MLLKNSCFCITHKSSVSTGFTEQIMPILLILGFNGSLVTWTAVSLPPPSLSLLYFLCLASPCPIPRTCLFSWFRMISACWLGLSLSLILRPTVSQPVYLGIKHPSGSYDQILITVRQLRVCWYRAFSLTRGLICRLQLLLDLASVIFLGSESLYTDRVENTVSNSNCIVVEACLPYHCTATAIVSLFVSRSLPSNGVYTPQYDYQNKQRLFP
jgi:hypothetical protein